MESFWNAAIIPSGALPNSGTSRGLNSANEYFWDQFGSQGNRPPMVLCERELNQLKGRIFNVRPEGPIDLWAQNSLDSLIDTSMHDMTARELLMRRLRMTVAVFRYLNHPIVLPIIQNNINNLDLAVGRLENLFPTDLSGAQDIFREFYPVWYTQATRNTRNWLFDQLEAIQERYEEFRELAVDPVEMQQFIADMIGEVEMYVRSPFSPPGSAPPP